MNISKPLSSTVTSISFSFLSTEDIRKLSVKTIVNPVLLDDLNRPNIGGLYDPALGPSNNFDMYVLPLFLSLLTGLMLHQDVRHVDLILSHVRATMDI